MAVVTSFWHSNTGDFHVDIDGLPYPANTYDRFEAELWVDGQLKTTESWTDSSSSTGTIHYYQNHGQPNPPNDYYSKAWGYRSGTKIYLGQG